MRARTIAATLSLQPHTTNSFLSSNAQLFMLLSVQQLRIAVVLIPLPLTYTSWLLLCYLLHWKYEMLHVSLPVYRLKACEPVSMDTLTYYSWNEEKPSDDSKCGTVSALQTGVT